MALSLLLVNLLLFHSAFTQISKNQALISGSGEVHLVPEEGGGNDSCTVPAYSRPLFEVNATEENVRLLLTEGRCYLSCLNRYPTMIMNVSLYPIWPFAVLNEDATCTSTITQLHECTRGCRTLLMNSTVTRRNLDQNRKTILGSCLETCMAECRAECGGQDRCENPDSIDLWVTRTGCTITCTSRLPCTLGCLNGEDIILEETPFDPVPPLPPVSIPTLVELKNSSISSEQGLYSVNLTNAEGDRDSGVGQWNAFLFQIRDLTSNNITYIWQHDPRIYLNLSSHICREVDVSFSVVNQFGSTSFSEPVRLTLRGDISSTVAITEKFEITTPESLQESSSTSFMPTLNLSQVGALMGGTVSVFIVIFVIITVVFVVIYFVSKRKLKKRREFAADVAITSGPTQEEEAEYEFIGPEVCSKTDTQFKNTPECSSNPSYGMVCSRSDAPQKEALYCDDNPAYDAVNFASQNVEGRKTMIPCYDMVQLAPKSL